MQDLGRWRDAAAVLLPSATGRWTWDGARRSDRSVLLDAGRGQAASVNGQGGFSGTVAYAVNESVIVGGYRVVRLYATGSALDPGRRIDWPGIAGRHG
jgi:hypothetical protein